MAEAVVAVALAAASWTASASASGETAGFTPSATAANRGETVTMTLQNVTGSFSSLVYNLGNGLTCAGASTVAVPTVSGGYSDGIATGIDFRAAGTFTVGLVGTPSGGGNYTSPDTAVITVNPAGSCATQQLSVTPAPNPQDECQPVTFTIAPAVGQGDSMGFDFGDGATGTLELAGLCSFFGSCNTIAHTYSGPGVFTVNANGTIGGVPYSGSTQVTINSAGGAVTASFTWAPATPSTGAVVTLTAGTGAAAGNPDQFIWSFPDTQTISSGSVARHVFACRGYWDVTLTVSRCSHSHSLTQRIGVRGVACAGACGGPYDLFVPAAAHTAGKNNSLWKTDLDLIPAGQETAAVEIDLLKKEQANLNPATMSVTVPVGQTVRLVDLLGSNLPAANAALGIRECTSSALINARFYNTPPGGGGGTFGMLVPALGDAYALTTGQQAVFHHLTYSTIATVGFRVNIGFANAVPFNVIVVIRLHGDAGQLVGTRTVTLLPYEHLQLTDIYRSVGAPNVAHGFATVELSTPDGEVHTYAMLIDNPTGDPLYMIPDLRPAP